MAWNGPSFGGPSIIQARFFRSAIQTLATIMVASCIVVALAPAGAAPGVYGAIAEKWSQLGREGGPLGSPTTSEAAAPYGGRFQEFQNGYIYWHPETGAFSVWGKIAQKWNSLGRVAFGYPITDELATVDGRLNHFRAVQRADKAEGSIYWTQRTGVHAIYGAIREKWKSVGWEQSVLGYPTSDEYANASGDRLVDFEHGYSLVWIPSGGENRVGYGTGPGPFVICKQWELNRIDAHVSARNQEYDLKFALAQNGDKLSGRAFTQTGVVVGNLYGGIGGNQIGLKLHTNDGFFWEFQGQLRQNGIPPTYVEGPATYVSGNEPQYWWHGNLALRCNARKGLQTDYQKLLFSVPATAPGANPPLATKRRPGDLYPFVRPT